MRKEHVKLKELDEQELKLKLSKGTEKARNYSRKETA
jgi:hypothetical protein